MFSDKRDEYKSSNGVTALSSSVSNSLDATDDAIAKFKITFSGIYSIAFKRAEKAASEAFGNGKSSLKLPVFMNNVNNQ